MKGEAAQTLHGSKVGAVFSCWSIKLIFFELKPHRLYTMFEEYVTINDK